MDIFDGRYYKTSKWFLEFLGLWPFQSNRRRYVTCFIFVFMIATVVFPQVLLLIELKTSNFNILIENSLSIIFGFACLLKYGVTFASRSRVCDIYCMLLKKTTFILFIKVYISFKQLQTLLTKIASDWQRLTDKTEIDILSQYGEEGRYLVLFYTVYVFLAWVTYNFLPFIPPLLDILLPLENGTHDLVYPFYADYVFFKQTDYHYESCLHVFFVYFGTTSLFAGMDTIYVATVKHSCGLFAVTLETMARTGKSNRSNYSIKPNSVVHHDMVEAIVMHNETIRSVELLEDSFSLCFLMVQCMVVAGLATLCFYMMRIYNQAFNMCRFSTFTIGLVIHLLYLNWVGQQIIDSSDKVFYSAYYSDWYLISRNERQLTKIILAKSLYPCQLTAGKISVLSMETFGALMKTSIRYYKSCKVLMEMLGLWPYQTLKRKRLTCIIFYSLHGSLLLPQVIRLLQTKDFNIIVENTISILFLFVCIAKYAVSYASGPNFKLLFTQIAADWHKITDKSEREILSKYGNDVYVFWAWATYNMMPFLPPILDIVLPLPNGSHPLLLPFYANYIFFEQLDYHYETALHAFFVYFFATSLFAGIDTIYVSTVKHTCGLFAIIW
ncbi:hypothetical protein TSAR_002954 [Trichomalopsis sarcophagae]|uniref:Odorant receptor n=1 Tax=Trichomalopsis sarcophagae TaxID=543379 RepID=A0A232FNH1_9HYME|nr:hypothetical protein TSAR_002954 [Trichomalopsis sarcophagae]